MCVSNLSLMRMNVVVVVVKGTPKNDDDYARIVRKICTNPNSVVKKILLLYTMLPRHTSPCLPTFGITVSNSSGKMINVHVFNVLWVKKHFHTLLFDEQCIILLCDMIIIIIITINVRFNSMNVVGGRRWRICVCVCVREK